MAPIPHQPAAAVHPAVAARQIVAARPGLAARPAAARPAVAASDFHTPDWVKDAVFYQVFPDRFRNGNPANDPAHTAPWGTPPQNFNFFQGGDLEGVKSELPYLQKLGVNALYLNPIFTSPSNHKYDTADYSKVDPAFGGDAAFNQLVDAAHAGGVKLILDGVLNHTSNENVWFKDVLANGPKSKYWSWYSVSKFPVSTWTDDKGVLRSNDYQGWGKAEWGGPYATLPVLNKENPEVVDALVTGKDSVVRHWLRDGKIDGWRMDVADEVDPKLWRQTRPVVKAENPEGYLVGENWHDASGMLQGDQFDGAMNYQYFQQPVTDFFAHKSISPDEFANRLKNGYPREAKLAMMNILESHDTPRFISQAGGDWARVRPAAIFQMTYQGAPSIFYGAEIGQEGGADPDSRRAFDWSLAGRMKVPGQLSGAVDPKISAEDKAGSLFGLYQKLIETRKGSTALRRGDFQVVATHDENNTIAYRRWVDSDAKDAVVALNNSSSAKSISVPVGTFAADGTAYLDALSGAKLTVSHGQLDLGQVDGNWGAVLLRQ